jgi:hypothetical protein
VATQTVHCQCGRQACDVELDVPAHTAAAAANLRLRAVAPGHVGDRDVVVDEHDGYWLVRSIDPPDGDDPSALSFPASDPPPGPGAV